MPDITSILIRANRDKIESSVELLEQLKTLIATKSADYGPVSEIIDLAFRITRYDEAKIPGAESQIAGRLLVKIIRYMNLRAQELIDGKPSANHESLEDSVRDIVGDGVRLYAEVASNRQTGQSR